MVISIYMGNTISRFMDYIGKRFNETRKGSPRYRQRKKIWKNKKDIANYRLVRGEDLHEDELYERDEDGVQIFQL